MAYASSLSPTARELDIMARTLYGEARGEELPGLVAVAWVIRNRAELGGWWGRDIVSVCLKPAQFSCWLLADDNRLAMDRVKVPDPAFLRCLAVSTLVLLGEYEDPTQGATHYYNPDGVKGREPYWASTMDQTVVVGRHRFCKERERKR